MVVDWPIYAALAVAAVAGSVAAVKAGEAAEMERQQFEEQQKTAEVAAIQDEAIRREELLKILATQDAIRAGRGLDLFSPTGSAVRSDTIATAERDIATSRLNHLSQARFYGLGAEAAGLRGQSALIGGIGKSVGDGLLGAARTYVAGERANPAKTG